VTHFKYELFAVHGTPAVQTYNLKAVRSTT